MSRPAVSKHLAILREAGLVVSHRAGRRQIYELDRAPFVAVEAWLARYRQQAGPTQRPVRWLRSRRVEPRDDWQCW